jgi:hypothetical protein
VAQSGSTDVGCGIVTPVSTVDWDVFSEALLAVVASVSRSVSTDVARWDDVRDVATELTLMYEAFFTMATAGELGALLVGVDVEGESGSLDVALLTDVLRAMEEELLEKGFCLILVR